MEPGTDRARETAEAAYRRGYQDGWLHALEALHDLAYNASPEDQAAFERLWDFGFRGALHEWRVRGQPQGAIRAELPPRSGQA